VLTVAPRSPRWLPPRLFGLTAAVLVLHWPALALAGIAGSSGAVVEVTAPLSVVTSATEDSANAIVFAEKQQITLAADLFVNVQQAGIYNSANTSETSTLFVPQGSAVNAYLLHADPVGTTARTYDLSVTFDEPILGIAVSNSLLDGSDLVGNAGTLYPSSPPDRSTLVAAPSDSLSLSADLRTITVRFRTGIAIDQMRVLTAPPVASSAAISTDVTVTIDGTLLTDESVGLDSFLILTVPVSLGGLPLAAAVTAYHPLANGDELFVLDTMVELAGSLVVSPIDIVRYDGLGYSLEFDGSAAGIADTASIDAVSRTPAGELLLSFDTTVQAGAVVADDEDVVMWDGVAFSKIFDGSAAGIATSRDLNGVHDVGGGVLGLSFDASGSVGGVAFADEDILLYDPSGPTWELAYDGSMQHAALARADVEALALPAIQDSDADGLADVAEQALGTNAANPDSDGDGLLDGFEVANEFDPSTPGEQSLDPDGDGLDNLAEQAAGTNPNDPDSDGDGFSDGVEIASGSDPLNPISTPVSNLPALGPWALGLLAACFAVLGSWRLAPRKRGSRIPVEGTRR
jgi:hypothetical protein